MRLDFAVGRGVLQVLGTGTALPGPPLTTEALLTGFAAHLSPRVAALARRLARRLAIDTRHLSRALQAPIEAVRPADSAPRLAARALIDALAVAKVGIDELGFLIGHTATPHTPLPSNTAWAADELAYSGPHVELRQACTGFAASLLLADGLLSAQSRTLAIVGSETGSVFFDPRRIAEDSSQLVNLVQMGDGAGAIVLSRPQHARASRIELVYYGSDGRGRLPGLAVVEGGSGAPRVTTGVPHFSHRYGDIRTLGVELLRTSLSAAQSAGVDLATVRWIVPHQANGRMAAICAEHLGVAEERVVCEASATGNVGSAAMWIALDRLRRSGRVSEGDRVLLVGAEATKYLYGGLLYVHGRS
jgi:3-oxoacyl-[acyl-carrier-protein] synthase-3